MRGEKSATLFGRGKSVADLTVTAVGHTLTAVGHTFRTHAWKNFLFVVLPQSVADMVIVRVGHTLWKHTELKI
jgi:hypothetical protein